MTLDQQLHDCDLVIKAPKEHLQAAKDRMKKYADKNRQDIEFKVEDWVYLKIRPYHQLLFFFFFLKRRQPL